MLTLYDSHGEHPNLIWDRSRIGSRSFAIGMYPQLLRTAPLFWRRIQQSV
ncbi:hypothetical protein Plhal304r1_c035g0109411 [Plasmopara halstedii]